MTTSGTYCSILRAALFGLLVVALCPGDSKADDSSVEMTASADTFAFVPETLVAHVGRLETIELTSLGGVHGVVAPEFGIDTTLVRPDHPVKLSFTPKTPGEYVVHCAVVCGVGHKGMAFRVTVEP